VQYFNSRILCHSCPPRIFVQEHGPHSITKTEGLAMEKNLAAQQIIAGHKKGFNETIYISSPKDMEET
jgi:hypothetical protein